MTRNRPFSSSTTTRRFAESTERLVRTLGFHVQTFASAQEFVDQAHVDGPACLVLDVHLPGQSGLDLQRELRQSGVPIPIIFITGRGSIPMSVRAMKDGAVEFLTQADALARLACGDPGGDRA